MPVRLYQWHLECVGAYSRGRPLSFAWRRFTALCFYLFRRLRVASTFSFSFSFSFSIWIARMYDGYLGLPYITHYTHPRTHASRWCIHAPHRTNTPHLAVACLASTNAHQAAGRSFEGPHQPCMTWRLSNLTRAFLHPFRYAVLVSRTDTELEILLRRSEVGGSARCFS